MDRMAWFREARFGMFIHWALFSMKETGYRGELSATPWKDGEAYSKLIRNFDAARYDPGAWVRLARRAGMRYMVLTTKHAQGFALFDTTANDFNVMHAACGRDLVREYVDACRKYGMRIGFYFALPDTSYKAWWDGPKKNPAGWQRFVKDVVHRQVRELMTRYGKIDLLWYDGGTPGTAGAFRSRQLNTMARTLQPEIIINPRSGLPEDFDTPECVFAPTRRDWEMCQTLHSDWSYAPWKRDYKPPQHIVRTLVMCAWRGGNYLLNVAPRADGSIPEQEIRILERVGRWTRKHGESIYGTDRLTRGFAHGFATLRRKDRKLYLHVMPGLWYDRMFLNSFRLNIKKAWLLKNEKPVAVRRVNGGNLLHGLPKTPPDKLDTVIVLEYSGPLRELAARDTIHVPAGMYN